MVIAFKHTGTLVDLTSVSTNPDAAPMTTPRQGGFTLRNRFGAGLADLLPASAVSGSSSAIANAPVCVLNVPARTMVTGLSLFSVPGETAPDITASASSASISSDGDYAFSLKFYAQPITKIATSSGVKTNTYQSQATITGTMGQILLDEAKSAGNALNQTITGSRPIIINAEASATTTPHLGVLNIMDAPGSSNEVDAGSSFQPTYFPHGGRINMVIDSTVKDSDTFVNATTVTNAGVWEIKATAEYVPE
jgi:hypothetical protein